MKKIFIVTLCMVAILSCGAFAAEQAIKAGYGLNFAFKSLDFDEDAPIATNGINFGYEKKLSGNDVLYTDVKYHTNISHFSTSAKYDGYSYADYAMYVSFGMKNYSVELFNGFFKSIGILYGSTSNDSFISPDLVLGYAYDLGNVFLAFNLGMGYAIPLSGDRGGLITSMGVSLGYPL
jgi:hypothetical protein